jgi:hypothetical protein
MVIAAAAPIADATAIMRHRIIIAATMVIADAVVIPCFGLRKPIWQRIMWW